MTAERRQYPESRKWLTVEEHALDIVRGRFGSKRPTDKKFRKALFTGGEPVKRAVRELFDRLDGKLDAEKVAKLKEAFNRGVDIWEQAGLFTPGREEAGYLKPDFGRDYQPLLTQEILDMTGEGGDLNRGYSAPVFAPMDVPFYDENPNHLSYVKLLKEVLFRALCRTTGEKPRNTLLVGPKKHIVTAQQVKLDEMVSINEHFLKDGVLFDVKKLSDYSVYQRVNMNDDVSERESLERLLGNEKRTGGVMRFERNRLIMPRDISEEPDMDAMDFEENLPCLLPNVDAQDIKQAIAYIIYCLEIYGWIPDCQDCDDQDCQDCDDQADASNLVIKNCVMGATGSGEPAVPVLSWSISDGQFKVDTYSAKNEYCFEGVRVGVRMKGV